LAARRSLRFRVAGLTLSVHAPRATAGLAPPPAFLPFLAARGDDIRLRLTEEAVPRPQPSDLLFHSGGVWRVHRWRGGYLYSFRTSVLSPPVYKAVAIDRALRRGTLHFPPPRAGRRPPYALAFPLDELLFQHRLAGEGGFEVHACGVVVGGRAVLFCGKSGAGKSTTARLWRRHRPGTLVLSDDRIAVRAGAGGYRAWGTPWHGDGGFASPEGRALGAVFFLRHGRADRVIPLAAPEAAARLFARTFPPPWEPRAVGRVLGACARIAGRTPCYELRFRPRASAVAAVLEALEDRS
jgi:hypothetical protein